MIEIFGYERLSDSFYKLNYFLDGEIYSTTYSLRRMVGFLRDKKINGKIVLDTDFNEIVAKYPYLEFYGEELSNALRPLIVRLLVIAIKNGDDLVANYILERFNLTEEVLSNRKVDSFNMLKLLYRKSDKDFYNAVFVKNGQIVSKKISFNMSENFCRDEDGRRIFLTAMSSKQLIEFRKLTEQKIDDVMQLKDGYIAFEFNGKTLYIKELDVERYDVWIFRKEGATVSNILNSQLQIDEILCLFGLKNVFRENFTFILGISDSVKSAIANDEFRWLSYARKNDKKYLEYQLKFLAGTASDSEISYLESVKKNNRFIPRKEDLNVIDVEILSAEKLHKTFLNPLDKWKCQIKISGFERMCIWYKDKKRLEFIILGSKVYSNLIECNITEELAEVFERKLCMAVKP